jgi:hypothetical protein
MARGVLAETGAVLIYAAGRGQLAAVNQEGKPISGKATKVYLRASRILNVDAESALANVPGAGIGPKQQLFWPKVIGVRMRFAQFVLDPV